MVDLKFSKPLVALISSGRSFHNLGATVEKAQSPYDCCLVLDTMKFEVLTGCQEADWLVSHHKLWDIVWRQDV